MARWKNTTIALALTAITPAANAKSAKPSSMRVELAALTNDVVVYAEQPKPVGILVATTSPDLDLSVVTRGLIANYHLGQTEEIDRDRQVQAALRNARSR